MSFLNCFNFGWNLFFGFIRIKYFLKLVEFFSIKV